MHRTALQRRAQAARVARRLSTTSIAAPQVIAESATLKAGQCQPAA